MKWHTTIFWCILTFLLVASVGASFVRFKINHDYLASITIECDPSEYSCYIECNDEACTDPYYYSYIERPAKDIKAICSNEDISQCIENLACSETPNMDCVETFCDPAVDSCSDKENI